MHPSAPKSGNTPNEPAPALDRLENDGGAIVHRRGGTAGRYDEAIPVAQRRILRRLGVAVLTEWNDLPVDVQRRLFKAASEYGASPPPDITLRIARFLHDHKDDIDNL
jgi:hypothetical protein